jgi:hypothetical protein
MYYNQLFSTGCSLPRLRICPRIHFGMKSDLNREQGLFLILNTYVSWSYYPSNSLA